MTKKRLFSSLAVAAMITSMFATTAFAEDPEWNSQGGKATVEGGVYTVEPTVEVAIPGDLTFGINPLKLNAAEEGQTENKNQIISTDYSVINYSNVPVIVDVAVTATAGSGVTMMDTAEYDANTSELKHATDTKNAFLCMSVNKTASFASDAFTFTYGTVDNNIKNATTAKAQASLVLSSGTASNAKFGLKAASTNMEKAAASFKFQGAVDPQSAFAEGDITVSAVYTLSMVTENQLTTGYEADTTALTDAADTFVKAK